MSQKIQFRRGTDAARSSLVLDLGEPSWTVDTKQLFIGDGITTGGLNVSNIVSNNLSNFTSGNSSSGMSLNNLNNDLFLRTQMGANGYAQHANEILLNKVKSKLATGNLFNVIFAGDGLVQYGNGGLFNYVLNGLKEKYGINGWGGAVFPYWTDSSSNPTTYLDDATLSNNVWLNPMLSLSGSKDYIILGPYFTAYKFLANTYDIYAVEGTGCGNITIHTGDVNGTNFVYYTGVNLNAAVSGGRKITVNAPTADYRTIRISGSGDMLHRVYFPASAAYNTLDTTNKIIKHDYSQNGGINFTWYSGRNGETRGRVRDVVWSGINPDLILVEQIEDAASVSTTSEKSGMYSFLADVKQKWPDTVVVLCAPYPGITDNRVPGVGFMRSGAISQKQCFFDGHTPFVNYDTWSSRGYGVGDGVHPSDSGRESYAAMLWNWLRL